MLDSKRVRIRKLISEKNSLGARDVERILQALGDEPEASLRRLRSKAIVSTDDILVFSDLLQVEFPNLVYFFANYKTGTPTPSKFTDDVPIVLFPSLYAAVLAALEVERERPAYNGPNYNRPDIFCRLPWPDELASNDPEKLIGGREFPDDTFRLACQYRDLGCWFMLHYPSKGYLYPRVPIHPRADWILDRMKLANEAYLPFEVLDAAQSEFFTLYDLNDAETTKFAKRAHALWRRIYTSKVAHYDPTTREIVVPAGWDGKCVWDIGKLALANALADPPRYAGFAPRSGPNGEPLMLGPLPKREKSIKPIK